MAEKYIGKAAVFGVTTTIASSSPANCVGTMLIQSVSRKREAVQIDLNEGAATKGRVIANKKNVLTISGLYTGTTKADALTQSGRLPEVGDIVLITNSSRTSSWGGKYTVVESSDEEKVQDVMSISLTIEQFVDADICATVS